METTDTDFFPVLKCHLKPLFLVNNSFKHLFHLCSYLPPFQSLQSTSLPRAALLHSLFLYPSCLPSDQWMASNLVGAVHKIFSELYLKMMSILVQTKAGSSCPPLLREKRPGVSSLFLLICRGDWVGWEPQGGTVAMRHPMSHGCSPWSEKGLYVPVLRCFSSVWFHVQDASRAVGCS